MLATLTVIVVLFALREAQAIVVPVLMAFFLALVAESPVAWLEKKGLSRIPAILLAVAGITAALFLVGLLIGASLQELSLRAPEYEQKLRKQMDSLLSATGSPPLENDTASALESLSPDQSLSLATAFLTGVSHLFSNAFLILITMVFMLLEGPAFIAKLEALGGSLGTWTSISESVRSYLAIKTLTSLATGVLVGLMLAVAGIEFAVLWALLAFLLNYVPNVGSILAAVPAAMLALLTGGLISALIVVVGYLLINTVIGNVVEPRIMGEGLGLSTLVVFLSLILWGWLLGAVGMLLSIPITTTLKIVLEGREETRGLALLLGSGAPAGDPPGDSSSDG